LLRVLKCPFAGANLSTAIVQPEHRQKGPPPFQIFRGLKAGLWIRIHWNPDPDPYPAFFVNPDPDPNQIRIRIQTEYGFESRSGSKLDPD
jgi:hypothetical protein